MLHLKNIKMKPKLISLFLLIGLVPLAIVGFWSSNLAGNALMNASYNRLIAVQSIKSDQVNDYLKNAFLGIDTLGHSKDVAELFVQLREYHNKTNVKADGSYDVTTPEYKALWEEYGKNVETYMKESGFYDIFMICSAHGHVMYSVAKESDLGTNLAYGQYRDTNLATVWAKVVKSQNRQVVDFAPYAPSNDEPAAFAGVPVYLKGQLVGVMAVQLSVNHFNDIMQQREGMGETGGSYLIGPDNYMRCDSYLDHTPMKIKDSFAKDMKMISPTVDLALAGKKGQETITVKVDGEDQRVISSYSPIKIGDFTWALLSEIDEAEIKQPIKKLMLSVIIIGVVLAAVIAVIAFLVARQIANPLVKGVDFAKQISGKDLTGRIDLDQGDEIGDLARALNAMAADLGEMVKEIDGGVNTVSSSSTEMASISDQLASSSETTVQKANTVSAAAEEMNSNMNSVASAMEQASANVSTVAAATDEMSASIGEISKNAENAKDAASNAVAQSEKASKRVNELGQAAGEIGVVTETIRAISDKTDLLAMNATIEAARAGDAGKGFAVVASEIKDLAKKTAESTEDISSRLQAIQKTTGLTVTEIEEVANAISQVDEVVTAIAAAVVQQNSATAEISENVGQTSLGLQEINENVNQTTEAAGQVAQEISEVNDAANEISNSSSQVQQSAAELSKLSEQLKEIINRFQV